MDHFCHYFFNHSSVCNYGYAREAFECFIAVACTTSRAAIGDWIAQYYSSEIKETKLGSKRLGSDRIAADRYATPFVLFSSVVSS